MPLSIALTADPELPVPPRLYGGIERIVDMLARGLSARGHDVTIFAHPDSRTAGRLIPWHGLNSHSPADTARNAILLAREATTRRFDVIHSFSRLAYLGPILPLPVPKLMSYQRAISETTVRFGSALARCTLEFTAASRWMMNHVKHLGRWHMVPNGVPLDIYHCENEVVADAPLVFLGRVEPIKGPHLAVQIARRTGLPLVIAGNISGDNHHWFESEIVPHLDGERIRYVGPLDDAQKNVLLKNARALLMPILWDEPFGIVMIEAMACGTPVLGFKRGAVPEVVEDGVTGFVRNDVDDLVAAMPGLSGLNRIACRQRVESTFSSDVVVEAYLAAYMSHAARKMG